MLVRSALHRDARKLPLAREVENIIRRQSLANNGVWYDPSDLSTLFQDAAGTILVTSVEQPVGKILDKSGRGNHATQSTAGYKPILSARVNRLTETEFRNGKADLPMPGGLVSASALPGYLGAIAFGYASGTTSWAYKIFDHTNGVEYSLSVVVKMDDGLEPAGDDFYMVMGGNIVARTIKGLGGGYYRLVAKWVSVGAATSFGVVKYSTQSNRTFKVTAYDLRESSIAGCPEYQRVNTASDYNTIGFPNYLAFDGLDDFLVTGNVDFSSSDKIAVAAGVRKLSDASNGALVEFSSNINTNSAAFGMYLPISTSVTGRDGFSSKGSVRASAERVRLAPYSAVMAGVGRVSLDVCLLRSDGVEGAQSPSDQGTDNYGNYPLYIGRRGGTSLPFNGRLYGLAICGGMDDIYKLKKIERYLATKTGVII